MYKLIDILEKKNITISWATIFVGYKLKIITKHDIALYAEKYLESNNKYSFLVSELVWENSDNVEEILEKILRQERKSIFSENGNLWKKEIRKWRFSSLVNVKLQNLGNLSLLRAIASLYVQFDYPSDMESFIYYLPPSDEYNPSNHTQEENYERLINLFDDFLKKEYLILINQEEEIDSFN